MRNDQAFRSELEHAIDFDTVLTQIASFASFSCSADAIRNAMPLDSLPRVRNDLALAAEGMAYEQSGGTLSLGGIVDISRDVQEADKGVTLMPSQLLHIASFLAAVRNASRAFEAEKFPLLHDIASSMDPCTHLFDEINKCIDLSGSVKEDATPALRSLHQSLLRARADLSAAGRSFLKHHSDSLMETMTTTIGGRMCVLLKASDKNKFGGMVHGTSQSGQAFYVEVNAFVDLNNEISSIQLEIEEEKKRICRELSRQVKSRSSALLSSLESLSVLDIAMAKGKWAAVHDGSIPFLKPGSREIRLEHAVHPLLDRNKAVANTYVLKDSQRALMISGPNMGGKTVTLKTIGLFAALAQSGFPVSAHHAVLPFYTNMFFDIGDNQSIENNLSTFSSHVKRLAEITSAADDHTFVLLDEAGNGTDPLEGAALAQAVLEYLIERDATIITSTHYNELKAYGKSEPKVLVSSVEFDPETLMPTYRYLPGVSGASYAFAIASQFDLAPEILDRAAGLKKENASEVEKQLEHLEHLQSKVQADRDKFQKLIADAHKLQKEAQQEKDRWDSRKSRLDEEYEAKLESMLEERREEAREILAEMRQVHGPIHEQIARMAKLDALEPETDQSGQKSAQETKEFKVGDYVRVEMLNNHGEILELKKKKAIVQVNGKKVTVNIDQLSPMARPKTEKRRSRTRTMHTFEAFPMELNLIGMRVEEGLQALDHYLDQAMAHRIKTVRIIHGVGTGALRSAVWQDLASRKHTIKSYTSGGPGEGGLGATIVEFQ